MTSSAIPGEEPLGESLATRGEPEAFGPTFKIDSSWLKPVWVGPYLLIAVLLVHLGFACFWLFTFEENQMTAPEVQVTLIPKGEAVTEVSDISAPQTAPAVSPDKPVDSAPVIADRDDPDVSKPSSAEVTPDLAPMLSAEAPKVQQPDAPVIPLAEPKTPRTEKPTPAPTEKILQSLHKEKQKVDAKQAAMRAARLDAARAHARTEAKDFSQGSQARHAGVRDGTDANAQMSDAAYAALVSAEVGRHIFYPSQARTEGAHGRASVFLSIGPSGSIISHSIKTSSGNSILDAAVQQIIASSHPPPPPHGHFSLVVPVAFNLQR